MFEEEMARLSIEELTKRGIRGALKSITIGN
jgi:hypothetical protein